MPKFEYIVHGQDIHKIITAKNRITADLIFSNEHPDITPTVIEHHATTSTKAKNKDPSKKAKPKPKPKTKAKKKARP